METSIAETVPLKCCSSSESSKNNQEEYEMEKVLEKIENSREISEEDKAQFNCSTLYAEVLKKVTKRKCKTNECVNLRWVTIVIIKNILFENPFCSNKLIFIFIDINLNK